MLIWQKTTSFETQMTKKEKLTNPCFKTFNVCSKTLKSKESFETPSPDFHLKLQFFFRKRCLLVSEDVQEKSFIFFYFFTFDEVHTPTCFRSQGTSCQNNFRWKSQRMKNKSKLSVSFFEITNEIGLQ